MFNGTFDENRAQFKFLEKRWKSPDTVPLKSKFTVVVLDQRTSGQGSFKKIIEMVLQC
jgi:hypothetical protein